MFCPSCGNQTIQGAEYCSRCGEPLGSPGSARVAPSNVVIVTAAVVALGAIGLAVWTTVQLQPAPVVNRAQTPLPRLLITPTPTPTPTPTESPSPSPVALPLPDVEPGEYKTYQNERFDFKISYPSNYLSPQGPPPANGDGRNFASSDGRVKMVVSGGYNAREKSLRELFDEQMTPARTVTYKVLKGRWFVLSGFEGDKVFYQKTLLKDDVIKTFHIEADRALQLYVQPMTEKMAKSFK